MDLRKPITRSLKNKRGMGIGDIYPAILAIGLIAILLGIVLFVLDEFADNMPLRSVAVANESLTAWVEGTNQTVAGASECGFETASSFVVYNTSSDVLIAAGNYTAYSDGKIINLTADISMYAWNISYVYDWGGAACDATEDIIEEIADFVPWIGIILLVIAAAIVLGLLVRNLAGGQRV